MSRLGYNIAANSLEYLFRLTAFASFHGFQASIDSGYRPGPVHPLDHLKQIPV